jgi:hypothetical protein
MSAVTTAAIARGPIRGSFEYGKTGRRGWQPVSRKFYNHD